MILSNRQLHAALDAGFVRITPAPQPRQPILGGPKCPFQTTAVDLRLGSEVTWLKPGLAMNVDLRRGKFPDLFGPNSEQCTITAQQPFVLEPGRFVLANTLETVEFPILETGPCFAGRMEGKSSFARCGLLVHFTAPTIHAGFSGRITLELINLGPYPISLFPEMPICQLIVETVDGIPFRNDSQFQGQQRAGGAAN